MKLFVSLQEKNVQCLSILPSMNCKYIANWFLQRKNINEPNNALTIYTWKDTFIFFFPFVRFYCIFVTVMFYCNQTSSDSNYFFY
jgi:hypothetical protein